MSFNSLFVPKERQNLRSCEGAVSNLNQVVTVAGAAKFEEGPSLASQSQVHRIFHSDAKDLTSSIAQDPIAVVKALSPSNASKEISDLHRLIEAGCQQLFQRAQESETIRILHRNKVQEEQKIQGELFKRALSDKVAAHQSNISLLKDEIDDIRSKTRPVEDELDNQVDVNKKQKNDLKDLEEKIALKQAEIDKWKQ